MISEIIVLFFLFFCSLLFILYSIFIGFGILKIQIEDASPNLNPWTDQYLASIILKMKSLSKYISKGAMKVIVDELKITAIFMAGMGLTLYITLDRSRNEFWDIFAFILGGVSSAAAGYICLKIALFTNIRVAKAACEEIEPSFGIAYKAGLIMGLIFISTSIFTLTSLMIIMRLLHGGGLNEMVLSIFCFGLGCAVVELCGRVCGGLFTKGADIGVDLVGSLMEFEEESSKNPGIIADQIGDNICDIYSMGIELSSSIIQTCCAAFVLSYYSPDLRQEFGFASFYFSLVVMAAGLIVCFLTSWFASYFTMIKGQVEVYSIIKNQYLISTILMTPVLFLVYLYCLPYYFAVNGTVVSKYDAFACSCIGLWGGYIIGWYFHHQSSAKGNYIKNMAQFCEYNSGYNILMGVAHGNMSTIIPNLILGVSVYACYYLGDLFGVCFAALGLNSTCCTWIINSAIGPIFDNARGITAMSDFFTSHNRIKSIEAPVKAAAIIAKALTTTSGFLVSLSLFNSFILWTNTEVADFLRPLTIGSLFVGGAIPLIFCSVTATSVGKIASAVVDESKSQLADIDIVTGKQQPNYEKCTELNIKQAVRDMISPVLLIMLTPFAAGTLFGTECVLALSAGFIIVSLNLALTFIVSGAAFATTKKYIEEGKLIIEETTKQIKSQEHQNAVVCDAVGDVFKDIYGPSLPTIMKDLLTFATVFTPFFMQTYYKIL